MIHSLEICLIIYLSGSGFIWLQIRSATSCPVAISPFQKRSIFGVTILSEISEKLTILGKVRPNTADCKPISRLRKDCGSASAGGFLMIASVVDIRGGTPCPYFMASYVYISEEAMKRSHCQAASGFCDFAEIKFIAEMQGGSSSVRTGRERNLTPLEISDFIEVRDVPAT